MMEARVSAARGAIGSHRFKAGNDQQLHGSLKNLFRFRSAPAFADIGVRIGSRLAKPSRLESAQRPGRPQRGAEDGCWPTWVNSPSGDKHFAHVVGIAVLAHLFDPVSFEMQVEVIQIGIFAAVSSDRV